jgi:hypothetical protein
MREFKFFQRDPLSRLQGDTIAILSLGPRHFNDWISHTFQNEVVERITSSRYFINGVRYVNVNRMSQVIGYVFTDWYIIDDILLTREQSQIVERLRLTTGRHETI